MSLPSSNNLYAYLQSVRGEEILKVGGNIEKSLGNFCAVRLSYALTMCGHPIKINSDYKDKNGNKYIIRVATMEGYLNDYYKKGEKVTSLKGLSGIVAFKQCGFSNATGHVDVVKNGNVADSDYSD